LVFYNYLHNGIFGNDFCKREQAIFGKLDSLRLQLEIKINKGRKMEQQLNVNLIFKCKILKDGKRVSNLIQITLNHLKVKNKLLK